MYFKKIFTKRSRGFTLIEVMAALVIAGLVLGTASQMLSWQTHISRRHDRQTEIYQASRYGLNLITRELRQARNITLLRPNLLSLTRVSGQVILFYVDDKDRNGINELYMETDGVANPVESNIDAIAFSKLDAGLWKISLTTHLEGVEIIWEATTRKRIG